MKILTLIALVAISCNHTESFIASTDASKIGHIKKVLIVGNSIVRHPPLSEIGWNNNWGMAASAIDSDFVHILQRKLSEYDVKLMYENYAEFERKYWEFDYRKADTLIQFKPDIIVMRIAENVNDAQAITKNFIKHYDSLLTRLDPDKLSVKVICNGWWPNNNVNRLLRDYAEENKYTFLNHTGLYSPATIALGEYKNEGVQQHPNNTGMRLIAESIWGAIKDYFK